MAMGRQKKQVQQQFWVATSEIAESPGHPFYQRLNALLASEGFDEHVEALCRPFYAEKRGRPSIRPGVYFRMLLVGFFEGLDSERGIAWRCADSLALRSFLGYALTERTPDHSSLSVIRQRLELETHAEVFAWVLTVLAGHGLVRGKTIGVDATTLEANAAMRSIVRRETGQTYEQFLTQLAQASGIETPTRADLAKLDRKRKGKGSNKDWENPHDPDAKITKMKDGRTHLAHKAEHAVDMDTGATVAVTVQPADRGDTRSLDETTLTAMTNLLELQCDPTTEPQVHKTIFDELVADKGYHSNDVLCELQAMEIRSYVSEPDRGKRNWRGKPAAKAAVHANRRRIRGDRGKRLQRQRGELLERPFAHCYETGGMRRTHLRGHGNILKRLLIHVSGCNLALVMRRLIGVGTPRGLQGLAGRILPRCRAALQAFDRFWRPVICRLTEITPSQPLAHAA
jgi:transposase